MRDKAKGKAATCAIVIACGLVIGVASSPLGVPLVALLIAPDLYPYLPNPFAGREGIDWLGNIEEFVENPALHKLLIIWCLALLASLGLAILLRMAQRPSRDVENGIFGDAKILEAKHDLMKRNDFYSGSGSLDIAGLALGSCKQGIWFDKHLIHSVIVGKSGAGKTAFVVLPTLHLAFTANYNVICTGKPEVYEYTAEKARALGYETVLLDLTGYPGASSYNPIDLVSVYLSKGDDDAAVRTARQVAADFIPIEGESNKFFPLAARDVLASLILMVCTADIPEEQKNLSTCAAILQQGTSGEDPKDPSAPLKAYIRSLGPSHICYASAADLLGDGGVTTAGKNVISTIRQALSCFSDAGLRSVTSKSDISIRDLIEKKTVVYIEMLPEGHPYSGVYRSFLSSWWTVAQEIARENAGHVPHRTMLVLDEIGNTGKVSCLPEIAAVGRSAHVTEHLFVQNISMLNRFNEPGDGGAGREKLLGSMSTKVALSLSDPADFKYFTELVGKHTVRSMGMGSQRGSSSRSTSESYSETAIPLVNEWEWQNRAPIRDGIIVIKGAENSKPGREGVFRFPVDYPGNTPTGRFFGLGTEEECEAKRIAFYQWEKSEHSSNLASLPPVWVPDFPREEGTCHSIETDEWSAWDGTER